MPHRGKIIDFNARLHDRAVALCDCNNFFVSCERARNRELENVPVVVLSSNDGCVVSRSNEAKRLNIPMGAPFFKFKAFFKAHNVHVCSGNLHYYGDVSHRVMAVLSEFTDNLEQYSIDEAFLNMAIRAIKDPVAYCAKIRAEVLDRCNIPVSIGISPNRTLSKLASEFAKKQEETGGVFWLDRVHYTDSNFMSQFAVGDVWGIGRKTAQKLNAIGIDKVTQLAAMDSRVVKERFGQPLLMTQWALQGKPAEHKSHSKSDPQQSIQVSRTFGERVTDYDTLLDALSNFVVSVARQLRRYNSGTKILRVHLQAGGFKDRRYYSKEKKFVSPQSLDAVLLKAARELLDKIYITGESYTKAGIEIPLLSTVSECNQQVLFDAPEDTDAPDEKKVRAEAAADKINRELGISIMKPASLFTDEKVQRWRPKTAHDENSKKLQDKSGMKFASYAEDV